jgi:hypothetical protein
MNRRPLRLWERIRIEPRRWSHNQYPDTVPFRVIGIIGNRCMYLNEVEGGWGWGRYDEWGRISQYHWQQDEIHHTVYQTLFAIDNGGTG